MTRPYDILAKLATPGLLATRRQKERCVEAVLYAIARVNVEYLDAFPSTPMLYHSGIVYRDDSDRRFDEWCDIPIVLSRGWGDCDDLVPWRLAELWRLGYRAEPMAIAQELQNGGILYHALIKMQDFGTEDPSRKLGMR